MNRVPHILKKIVNTTTPTNLFFFDTETKDANKGKDPSCEKHKLWFGCTRAYRYEGGQRTRYKSNVFKSIGAFWDILLSRLDKKRTLMVYCHNAGFDLTIVDFWRISNERKWTIDFAVLESPPVIISVSTPEGRFNVVDTVNYFKVPLKVLGDSLGLKKIECDITTASFEEALPYCQRDVEIIDLALERLIHFVRDNELGKLGSTVASLAFSAFRHRFMQEDIYIHDRERVLKLEKNSYFGGLVNCLYVGKVRKTRVYKLDVNSLYPTVMLNSYPVKLEYALENPSVKYVASQIHKRAIVAEVSIETDKEVYPYRNGRDFICPTGRYITTLCGPELELALKRGHVKRVWYAAFYHTAPIFKSYVKYFWEKRKQYKANGDKANDTFCKLMLNSLYGKFAQHHYKWQPLTPDTLKEVMESLGESPNEMYSEAMMLPNVPIGQKKWAPEGSKLTMKLRSMGAQTQIQHRVGWHAEAFIAVASYVTSYARRYLTDLLNIVGKRHCFYYDTDSLFVDHCGKDRLRRSGKISETELGKLKDEGDEYEPVFLAPKDYLFGKEYKLKGIRKPGKDPRRKAFKQLQFEGLPSVINRGGEAYILIKKIVKNVTHRYKKGVVADTGWTIPLVIGATE